MGEAGNTDDVICDLRDEVVSFEEALSQMGTSSKMPFHFVQHSRLPSECHHCLIIDKVTQQKKIGLSIASELE